MPDSTTHPRLSQVFAILVLFLAFVATSLGQQQPGILADILRDRPALTEPGQRAQTVAEMRRVEEERKAFAVRRATELGLPIRVVGPGFQVSEIMDFRDDRPIYAVTTNREAAITTAANTTRTSLGINGGGFTIGVWDGGAVRASHQEFQNRVSLKNNVSAVTHATHVAGTIGAAGVDARAMGMTPGVSIDSYDWNNDKSEMTSRGAAFPGEPGAIYISNHSYGYRSGWSWTDRWEWFGQGTNQNAVEPNFGRYNSHTLETDAVAYSLPYYLSFWSAGNDRNNNPSQGETVRLGGSLVSYNSAIHPPGDGIYKGGYDLIGFDSAAKNVMTIGAVDDAVTFGMRDLSKATMAVFSSWGPTDDGRIKPDIVANGVSLFSPTASNNSSYGNLSGTSMAAPNASGSAQLLVSYFNQLFPGHFMRASTLKGLIIHTADDLGTPGPNYQFGWGLMNTQAAAEKIAAHYASPGSHRIVEGRLATEDPLHTFTFAWDGVSPIRATLTWTDPPLDTALSGHDNRTPHLVNNLDLTIHDPNEGIHMPYVMPYVGDWSQAMLSAPATTGKNDTDNVEQVFIASPPAPGIYTATITVDGPLTNGEQYYSLIVSGSAPVEAPPPELAAISPDSANGNFTIMTLSGSGFQTGASVSLSFPGQPDRTASSQIVIEDEIVARINTGSLAGGFWDVVVTNPDGQQAILPGSFAVGPPIWSEDFEGSVSGWSNDANPGTTGWALTQTLSNSPFHSYHAPGPATHTIDNLYSPIVPVPDDEPHLILSFWHSYEFTSNDGGVIEFSLDGGPWFDPTSSGSGAAFTTGGYNGSVSGSGGPPNSRNALGDRSAWIGSKAGFSEVAIDLDAAAYGGRDLRIRWRLGTNNQTASPGWYVDDVVLSSNGSTAEFALPSMTVAPHASESPVSGLSVDLYAEAENSDSSPGIIYTWTVNDTVEYPVSFDDNATETAGSTTAHFSSAGSYQFTVTARNVFNASVSDTVDVDVLQTATSLRIEPETATVAVGHSLPFVSVVSDQFGIDLDTQPLADWTIDPAAGHVSAEGLFTAGNETGGPFSLIAAIPGGIFGTADLFIRELDFTDWQKVYFTEDELFDPEISSETADPDGDNVNNLLEYALGGDPLAPDRSVLPQTFMEDSSEGIQMVFIFSRPAGLSDVDYQVVASSDLINWTPVPLTDWEIVSLDETETVTIRKLVSDDSRLFLRLEVQRYE